MDRHGKRVCYTCGRWVRREHFSYTWKSKCALCRGSVVHDRDELPDAAWDERQGDPYAYNGVRDEVAFERYSNGLFTCTLHQYPDDNDMPLTTQRSIRPEWTDAISYDANRLLLAMLTEDEKQRLFTCHGFTLDARGFLSPPP